MYKLIPFILAATLLTGCDTNKEENIDIVTHSRYINTTETTQINSYNGYKLIELDKKTNSDNSVIVILKFNRIIK